MNMELGLNRENVMRTLRHLGTVALAAALTAVVNELGKLNLDPFTMGVIAAVSPILKLAIESVRK
jgi:hypothetical protein